MDRRRRYLLAKRDFAQSGAGRCGLPELLRGGDPGGAARRRARPVAKDALNGTYLQHQLARIYILVGEPEKDQLEPLLKIP